MRQFAVYTIFILLLWSSAGTGKDQGKETKPASGAPSGAGAGVKPKADTPTPAHSAAGAGVKPNADTPTPAHSGAGAGVKPKPDTPTPAPGAEAGVKPKANTPTPAPAAAAKEETATKPTPAPTTPPSKTTSKPEQPPPAVVEQRKVVEKPKVIEKLGEVSVKAAVVHLDTKAGEWKDLAKGQKLPAALQLHDVQERLNIKITAARKLHQVFVLLRNKATDEEVGFIGQLENEQGANYKVDIDIASTGFEAGTYEIVLFLGDFSIDDSMEWTLGDLNFKVAGTEHQVKARPTVNPLYSISYEEKPEIKHQFRQPEPRPPKVVSNFFTLLVLSPLLILFILWIKIGVNISNFPFTLSALSFHLGLAAIFGVYGLFWIKLTMFEALKWMGPPGVITFIAGNRLLNYIAERRSK